ncbi:EAL domain-containing protein, partial [Rhodoplanes roseus]|uniref:EAL domain-containing protein n=1 Tax=Rhodoplanes roseus TaxID=29409 RepID=UPI001AECC672
AETVATHDTLLRSGAPGSPYVVPAAAGGEAAARGGQAGGEAAARGGEGGGQGGGQEPATGPSTGRGFFAGRSREASLGIVRDALDAGRVELLLQPIVMLPQRKVRYYEAVARLRTADGGVVMPADFLPVAEAGGLIARLDNAMLFRAVQVVRRLLGKNRDIGLFCNVSAATLVDPEFFPQFNEFADANKALAPSFVFEFRQDAYRSFGPMENESLAALTERGFRFSLDHVGDMRLEPRDLADRGFRFVKVPASLLLSRHAAPATDIHPADLSGLLGRYGIELIAERIETESTVVDLLDYDLKYGQGFLFSPPRPVRPEVLQGGAERPADLAGAFDGKPSAPAPGAAASAAPPAQNLAAVLGLRPAVPVAARAPEPTPLAAPAPVAVPAAAAAPPPSAAAVPVSLPTPMPESPPLIAAAPTPAPLPTPSPPPSPLLATPSPAPSPPLAAALPPGAAAAPVIPAERRPIGAVRGHPGTVLAQIARGMLARK